MRVPVLALLASAAILAAVPARAQQEGPPSVKGVEAEDLEPPEPPVPSPSPVPAPAADDDREIDPAEPDFVIVNLPSQARLPRHSLAFRVTHRFSRPLGDGDLGDLAGDLFGFDSGGLIGLELRYGIARATQAAVLRTSDRTIQLSLQRDLRRAADHPFGAALFAAVEGLDNFGEDHAPGAALILSRHLGDRGAVYVTPAVVARLPIGVEEDADTETAVMVGLAARLRFTENGALLLEFTPRLNAPDGDERPFRHPVSFGLEKKMGGHAFQLNVSNTFANTLGQLARGGVAGGGWYIGFNISRKFY
jgi:hypothetical protein